MCALSYFIWNINQIKISLYNCIAYKISPSYIVYLGMYIYNMIHLQRITQGKTPKKVKYIPLEK